MNTYLLWVLSHRSEVLLNMSAFVINMFLYVCNYVMRVEFLDSDGMTVEFCNQTVEKYDLQKMDFSI